MKVRKSLVGLGIAGSLALTAAAAFAQMPGGYPGMGGGGYPGMGGGYPGMPGGAAAGAPAADANGGTVTTSSVTTTSPDMPKTGGDPLTLSAAGSLLLSGGYAIRRKFRRA